MANPNFKRFVWLTAFLGTMCIAIALALQAIFKTTGTMGQLVNALRIIGEVIAYTITCVSAFFYVRSKRNVGWMIAYVIAVTVIVILVVVVNII